MMRRERAPTVWLGVERRTCRKRHELIKLLSQISLDAIRSLGRAEAAFGVVGAPEHVEFGGMLDLDGDGDDDEVSGGEWGAFLAAVDDVLARVVGVFFTMR